MLCKLSVSLTDHRTTLCRTGDSPHRKLPFPLLQDGRQATIKLDLRGLTADQLLTEGFYM